MINSGNVAAELSHQKLVLDQEQEVLISVVEWSAYSFAFLLLQNANPSVVYRLSLFVRPTQGIETFGNIFAILYLSHPLTSVQKFTYIVPAEPLPRGVIRIKRKRWTHRRLQQLCGAIWLMWVKNN